MNNQSNLTKYRILAPIYDRLMGRRAFRAARARALSMLAIAPGDRVLLVGVGTGEDLPFLPPAARASGIDLSAEMLDLARAKAPDVELRVMNAESLEYPDASFDKVVLNLVLSVVEHTEQALAEALRVLAPNGTIVVFDKFLQAGTTPSLGRRALNVLTSSLGTDINRCFDDISRGLPCERLAEEASIFGGSYRILLLGKTRAQAPRPEAASHPSAR